MNKRDLFSSLNEIERHLQSLLVQVSDMKAELTDVVENLEIENKHVRDRLQELEEANNENAPATRRSGKALEKLYHDGYHVCQERYGAKLDSQNDECMFCLNVIDGLNHDK